MANAVQITNGIVKYIDAEILAKIEGWQKWVVGVGASLAVGRAADIYNTVASHPVVKMLGVVDEQGGMDIEVLHKEFAKQAQKGPITFSVPMIGPMTLNSSDVEKLYHYIKESTTS